MKRNLSNEHPEDATQLAYLDAELPGAATRRVLKHLQTCWRCRSTLAELELLAQAASKLLSQQDESDIARMREACAKFLQLKASLEERSKGRLTERRAFFKMPSMNSVSCEYSTQLLVS
jgi:anti-sigma factor RsiW